MQEGRIGCQESAAMAGLSAAAKVLFVQFEQWGRGGVLWQTVLGSALCTLALFFAAAYLLRRTGAQNLFDAFDQLLGRKGGGVCKLALCAAQGVGMVLVTHSFCTALKRYSMVNTPVWFILALLLGAALPAAWMGLEIVGRQAKILLGFFVLAAAVAVLGASWSYEGYRLYPLLGEGGSKIAANSLGASYLWVDILLLPSFGKAVGGGKSAKRSALFALALAAAVGLLSALGLALALPFEVRDHTLGNMHRLASMLSGQGTLRQLGEFLIYLWFAGVIGALSFSLYSCARSYCAAFGIGSTRRVLPAVAVLLFYTVLLLEEDLPALSSAAEPVSRYAALLAVLPLLFGVAAAWIRRNKTHDAKTV